MITLFYSNIALPNNFVDKDLESKLQDYLRLDKECYPQTEAKSSGERPASIVSGFGRIRDYILVSDQL